VYAEQGHALAREFLDRSIAREIDLIAPDLLYTEMASLLSKKHRRGVITAEQARTSFSYIQNAGLRIYDTVPRVARALQLSLTSQLSIWDSVYLTLALEHKCAMLTADSRLHRSGKALHTNIRLLQ